MITPAQIAANQENAQASTGPRTESGKQISAQNSTTTGLFAQTAFIRPDEQEIWQEFTASFQTHLAPVGPLEATLTSEITGAAWRLRRCNLVEASLDPAIDPITSPAQNSIDRARTQAQRHFQRNLTELKRLQTERQFRKEYFPESVNTSDLGVASVREIIPILQKITTTDPVNQEMFAFDALKRAASDPNWVRSAKSTQTPRNATCPCGSGTKYKRCCGTNSPAVLSNAA